MSANKLERADFDAQVSEFGEVRSRYVALAAVLEAILREAAKTRAPLAIVQSRAKDVSSFAGKISRKTLRDPVREFTDLCGVRLILHLPSEVERISEFIEHHFEIDPENSADISQHRKPVEFGYRSVHYIVRLIPGTFPNDEIEVETSDSRLYPSERCPMKAEIQVRTLLEHAWADFSHDRFYKCPFDVPRNLKRELAGVAAMLEGADRTFERLVDELALYESNYGAFLSRDEIVAEISKEAAVYALDAGSSELALRIAMLAVAIEDWNKVITVLMPHAGSSHAPVLRTLGMALCKQYKDTPQDAAYQQGRDFLEKAHALQDVDAIASLAGTYKETDSAKAHALYREAHDLDPSDPYPLMNLLQYEIISTGTIAQTSLLKPVIQNAIQRCIKQAEVGVNLPWAYYTSAFLRMLLTETYECISDYTKALETSNSAWMIDTALTTLHQFDDIAEQAGLNSELSPFNSAKVLLILGKAVKSGLELEADEHVTGTQSKQKAEDVIKSLKSQGRQSLRPPVVVFAGGCDDAVEDKLSAYDALIQRAFESFSGVVIGGGTRAGVSGLAGNLRKKYGDSIYSVGYRPEQLPAGVEADNDNFRDIRMTKGSDFSLSDCLQYWCDILGDGIHPGQVRVLGINGGTISALEYRIALVLGADVGIIKNSGREADRLLNDSAWQGSSHLVPLIEDAATLQAFLTVDQGTLPDAAIEQIARMIHTTYQGLVDDFEHLNPSAVPWETLPQYLKESNFQQARDISNKLHLINCDIRPVEAEGDAVTALEPEEIERLAEREHGRWNVERLRDGWKAGTRKDVARKMSPCLVSWDDLPEPMRVLDRSMVAAIPGHLARVGFKVCRL